MSTTEWRRRARYALYGSRFHLARQLLISAQLVKLWREPDAHWNEDLIELQPSALKWFVDRIYQRYLTYVDQAREDGIRLGKREDILGPWATYLQPAQTGITSATLPDSARSGSGYQDPPRQRVARNEPVGEEKRRPDQAEKRGSSQYDLEGSDAGTKALPLRPLKKPSVGDDVDTPTYSYESSRIRPQRQRHERIPTDYQDPQTVNKRSLVKGDDRSRYSPSKDMQDPPRLPKNRPTLTDRDTGEDSDESEEGKNYTHVIGTLDERVRPRKPPTDPIQRLSPLMVEFINIDHKDLAKCRDFCIANPGIFDEDTTPLQAVASDCLGQNRKDTAKQVVQRLLMIRDAKLFGNTQQPPVDYLRRLCLLKPKRDILESNTNLLLDSLADRLVPTSSYSGGVSRVESSRTDPGSRRRPL